MTRLAFPGMVGFFVLAGSAAYAQSPAQYTVTVTPQNMAMIGKALGQMPYSDVAVLIADLQRQMVEQNKAAADAAKKPDDKPPSSPPGE